MMDAPRLLNSQLPFLPKAFLRRRSQPCENLGFTLIEILVCTVIVAFLIALLFPAVMKAQVQSKRTQSAANLRAIGGAIFTYAGENDGTYPVGCNAAWTSKFWSQSIAYALPATTQVTDFNGKPRVISKSLVSPFIDNSYHHNLGDYAGNMHFMPIEGTKSPVRQASVETPGQKVLVFSGEWKGHTPPRGTWYANVYDFNNLTPGNTKIDGLVGALFADGHVEEIPREKFVEERDAYLKID